MKSTDITPGSILVGVDGSDHSDHAVVWAAEQAALEGRPLVLVHAAGVGDVRSVAWTTGEAASPGSSTDVLRSGRAIADKAAALARSRRPQVETQSLPVIGDARQVLVDLSEKAHLVVVGSRGRGVFRSVLLGSVSASVARHARCPLMVVRPGRPGLVKDGVLVGADGTAESLPVVEFAFRQASLRGLPLTVMHCIWDVNTDSAPDPRDLLLLSESVAGLSEKFPDVHVTRVLDRGFLDVCLIREARPRHLVVVGRHRVHTPTGFLRGSVATSVIERSNSTVAVVPEADPETQS